MAEITNVQLDVRHVSDHPGQRVVVVDYQLDVPAGDELIGQRVTEEITVRARDEHDAPVPPRQPGVSASSTFAIDAAGTIPRHHEQVVDRTQLDVEEDWWRSGPGGEVLPIAELLDHLTAEVIVSVGDHERELDASSPPLTGSWGALGRD